MANKTLELSLSLNEDTLHNALAVLHEAGFTPEALMIQVLERCAREGELPLKKSRGKRKMRPSEVIFSQDSLFGEIPGSEVVEGTLPAIRPTRPEANLQTLAALQESQAMLRWRARERGTLDEKDKDSALGSHLGADQNAPLTLLETRQFRSDKQAIIHDPARPAIIHALEVLFTTLTHRRRPELALSLSENDEGQEFVVPILAPGLEGPRVLIYQQTDAEVCCVRYGDPEQLLRVVPASLIPGRDGEVQVVEEKAPIDFDNLPTIPPIESLFMNPPR